MTVDQYAALADVFGEADRVPLRVHAELPTFVDALGPVTGAHALDLACGAGLYTRILAGLGAREVVGVDVSAAMIEQARAATAADTPVRYEVHGAADLPRLGEFDVVTAMFLLNYATGRDELAAMCTTIADHLRPGGRFVGSVPSSDYDPDAPIDLRYGLSVSRTSTIREGDPYDVNLHLSQVLSFEVRYWTLASYRAALETAGLTDVRVRPWQPSAAGIAEHGTEFWASWIRNPLNAIITARKPKYANPTG